MDAVVNGKGALGGKKAEALMITKTLSDSTIPVPKTITSEAIVGN